MVAVVLLGAGASFGSGECYFGSGESPVTKVPPLGGGLFAELAQHSKAAASVPEHIKATFARDFEAGMAEYFDCENGNIMSFQRELAYYLARFRPGAGNVYIKLMQALGWSRVIYCSLNYDLLFEASAHRLRMNVWNGTQPPRLPAIRLLKPHGSSNFWPEMNGNQFFNCSFEGERQGTAIEAPIRYLGQEETLRRCQTEDSWSPAIAMFDPTKHVQVCTTEVSRHRDAWIESVNKATQVFVVGVNVHPVDEHIWGTLARCRAPVFYYGPCEGDRDRFNEWTSCNEKRNAHFELANFAQSVPLMRMRLFGR